MTRLPAVLRDPRQRGIRNGVRFVWHFCACSILVLVALYRINVVLPSTSPDGVRGDHASADNVPRDMPASRRLLSDYPPDAFTDEQRENGAVILHAIGVLYMFLALAIVCDEFFVPALDVLTDDVFHLDKDVAGATLMAAGGSAPELFTSFIGTFTESDVGFGTIVGSAVFNVLFVIGMCAFYTGGDLPLTWWPLARDVFFYALSLIVLSAVFYDQVVEWWESLLCFLCYVLYVSFMSQNTRVWEWVELKMNGRKEEEVQAEIRTHRLSMARLSTFHAGAINLVLKGEFPKRKFKKVAQAIIAQNKMKLRAMMSQSGKKTGGLSMASLAKSTDSASSDAIVHGVTTSPDDETPLDAVVVDKGSEPDGSESIGLESIAMKDSEMPETEEDGAPKLPDPDPDPEPNEPEPEPEPEEESVSAASAGSLRTNKARALTRDKLTKPNLSNDQKADSGGGGGDGNGDSSQQDDVPLKEKYAYPRDAEATPRALFFWWILAPIVWPLMKTLPDCTVDAPMPKKKFQAFVGFFGSVVWIAVYSYLMVWWTTMVGNAAGIPDAVMGLTFLAAGTSVPDLLTSIIVARDGEGNMAVSSSIGSNIFDVTFGLPIPWLAYSMINGGAAVEVKSDGLFISVVVLFGMLLAMILGIVGAGWRLTRGLGAAYLVLYVLFVTQAVLVEFEVF